MCDENVLKFCSIACSSPISHSTSVKMPIVTWLAGKKKPVWQSNIKSPTVLRLTVFPPVLGPVIMSVLKLSPIETSIGTHLSLGMSGCLPFTIFMHSFEHISGFVQSNAFAKPAFAKSISSITSVS